MGAFGSTSRNASVCSSSYTILAGISFRMIFAKMLSAISLLHDREPQGPGLGRTQPRYPLPNLLHNLLAKGVATLGATPRGGGGLGTPPAARRDSRRAPQRVGGKARAGVRRTAPDGRPRT